MAVTSEYLEKQEPKLFHEGPSSLPFIKLSYIKGECGVGLDFGPLWLHKFSTNERIRYIYYVFPP